MNRIIILLGQRKRSGTNFIGSTLAAHPDLISLPPNKSLGEFNIFRTDEIISNVYETVTKRSFGLEFREETKSIFLEKYAKVWMDILVKKFDIPEGKIIFIKSPIIEHIDLWLDAFPNAKIAVITRDGRDNVISSIKASNDRRSWYGTATRIKKQLNFLSGRLFLNHSRHWGETARILGHYKNHDRIKFVKYESLINSEDQITELLKHYDIKVDEDILRDCLKAPVVGSSFGNNKNARKPNWTPDADKSNYQFTGKWKKWGWFKRKIFKKIAGLELIELGYEQDKKW